MTDHATEIGKVASFINGFPFKPEDWATSGLPIIRIQNLTDPSKPFNLTTREVDDRYLVNKGDVLVSWSATIDVFEWAGDAALLNQHIFKVDFDADKIDKQYFKVALKKTIADLSKFAHGSTMKHVVKKDFENHQIPFPPLDDQIRIAHLLGKVEGLIAQRKHQLQQLDELLKSVFLDMFGDPVRNEKGWEQTTIGDSVEIQSGQIDPRESPYSEMLHIGGANIESESGNFINLKQAKYENLISGKYLFDDAYILYSKIRPYLNKVAKPDFEGICSADIYPIKPIGGLLNRDFLRFLLLSKLFLNYTANNSDRANIPKINRKALIAFRFNRPPIELQNQFSVIVEKIEALKSRYQHSLTDLEALYGALSQQAFKGELDLSRVPLPKPPT